MSKPTNFSYSNTLINTQQKPVLNKGPTNNTGNTSSTVMPASSPALMPGFSRPNVNIGHVLSQQTSTEQIAATYKINLYYRGPFQKPYPMKHWRRQLSVNGQSGQSMRGSLGQIDRPGGTTFRGYAPEFATKCTCDPDGSNIFITFDNKFLQSTSCTIKPQKQAPLEGTFNGDKIYNPGFVNVGTEPSGYHIQTGIYQTKSLCNSQETKAQTRVRTSGLLSKSYFVSNKEYLKNKCSLFSQKQSINPIQGNNYTAELEGQRSTQYATQNCTGSYTIADSGKTCTNVTYYNPSNSKFQKQGAVDSSTRLLRLQVDTITKNANSFRSAWGDAAANAGKYQGNDFQPTFIKSKFTLPLSWSRQGDKYICGNPNYKNQQCSGPRTTLGTFWSF